MKLSDFLSDAKRCGFSRVRVISPRGHDLVHGTLSANDGEGLDAKGIEARIAADAERLPADAQHEYTIIAEGDAGRFDRFPLFVHGGLRSKDGDEHRVEPSTVRDSATALGHMCRVAVDLSKLVKE